MVGCGNGKCDPLLLCWWWLKRAFKVFSDPSKLVNVEEGHSTQRRSVCWCGYGQVQRSNTT